MRIIGVRPKHVYFYKVSLLIHVGIHDGVPLRGCWTPLDCLIDGTFIPFLATWLKGQPCHLIETCLGWQKLNHSFQNPPEPSADTANWSLHSFQLSWPLPQNPYQLPLFNGASVRDEAYFFPLPCSPWPVPCEAGNSAACDCTCKSHLCVSTPSTVPGHLHSYH